MEKPRFDWDRDIGSKVYLFGRPLTKKRIFNAYWLFDARQGRGSGYINEIRVFTYIPVFGVIYLMFPAFPKWTMIFLILGFITFTYVLGYIDEHYIKYWHYCNEKDKTYKVMPYERRIERRLVNIEKKLKIDSEVPPYEVNDDGEV